MDQKTKQIVERLQSECEIEDQIAQLECDVRAGRVSDMVAAFKLTLLRYKLSALSKQGEGS